MAVPTKCMISWLHAWKMKQKKLNKMKKWICRQAIILFMSMHPLCQCFPVIFSNHLASILPPYPLPYRERWQKSKNRVFFQNTYGKKLYSHWKPIVFWWFQETGQMQRLINLLKNHFILEVLSYWLVHTFSSKSDEILILAPTCLNLVFRYKIFKYQFWISYSAPSNWLV